VLTIAPHNVKSIKKTVVMKRLIWLVWGWMITVQGAWAQNHSMNFDGVDDYVALPSFPHLSGSRTVTAWFKTKDRNERGQRIFADDEYNRDGMYAVSVGDPGSGRVRFYIRGLSPVSLDSNPVVQNDRWYFVAATFDIDTMVKRLVIYDAGGNKIDEVSQSVSGTMVAPTGTPSLGGETDNGETANRFKGEIDEIKVFDKPLSAEQIRLIMENERGKKSWDGRTRYCRCRLPIAEYRMDECHWSGAAGEVEDSIGEDNNGSVTGSGADTSKDGILCRTGNFIGAAIDISGLNVSTASGDKTTVMFWMYWDGTNSVMPFGWNIYDLWFYNGSFGFNTGNGDIYGISSSGLSGGWHHVAAVFTNGDVHSNSLYIDGVKQNLTQRRRTPNNRRAVVQSSARIGGWLISGGYRFRGKIDELKIYNGEVVGADIKTIYDNEKSGLGYDGTARECKCAMPVGEWRMDECDWSGAAGEVLDSSGNGLDGTALNGASTGVAKLCMGGSFDGLDDAVQVADSDLLDGTQTLTLMGWIKPKQLYQTNGSNARGILSKRRSAGSDESYGIFFWNGNQMVDDDGDGDPDRAKLYIDIDGNNDRFSTNAYISKGVWTHVAVVYDGSRSSTSRVEVYINGQLDKTAAESSGTLPNYASDLYIGDLHYPNEYKVFKGLIDEVKVFDRALNADQIRLIVQNESAGKNYDRIRLGRQYHDQSGRDLLLALHTFER